MSLGLRVRLLAVAVPPFALVAGLALAGLPNAAVAGAAAVSALAVGAAVALLTGPFERLRATAAESLKQAALAAEAPPGGDGTGAVRQAISGLLDELRLTRHTLQEREQEFYQTLTGAAQAMSASAKDWRAAPSLGVQSPWAEPNAAFAEAFGQLAGALSLANRRANGLQAVLNDIPEGVVVLDAKQQSQYLNAAAEHWFGHLNHKGMKQPARALLCDAAPPELAEADGNAAPGAAEVVQWLSGGRGGLCEAVLATEDGPMPAMLSALPASERRSGQSTVVLVRDLTTSKKQDAHTRHLHRRMTGQRLSLLVAKEGSSALDVIRTQAGLLAQAAKQAGQRERFIPKVERIIEEVNRQALVIDLLGWLGRLTTTSASEPETEELRLRTAADDVADRLRGAISERGNRLQIEGDAGWLIADSARVETLLTGLVLHANQCSEQAELTMSLSRRSAVSASEELGEVIFTFPSQPLSAASLADIRDPFRRPNSGVFDGSGRHGFLLGLAVAHRIAGLMGGELDLDSGGGNTTARVTVPTRGKGEGWAAQQASLSGSGAVIPGSDARDALAEFSLGGAANGAQYAGGDVAQTPAPGAAVAVAEPPHADAEPSDRLDSFFGPG